MKENRALSGGLCALGCEVLYGLSYLFTKRTADAASALALLGWRFIVALAVMSLCVALGLVKVRLRGRRLWPLLRVALFCPCLYFIGETVGIRETTVTESGVFLACGSVTDPEKEYHLEFVLEDEAFAAALQRLIARFSLSAHLTKRRAMALVYLKGQSEITDMLSIFGAQSARFAMEDAYIRKELRNNANRAVNCDSANADKIVLAAQEQLDPVQCEMIRYNTRRTVFFVGEIASYLPPLLGEMAELRLAHPEMSLEELGRLCDPPVGKSGVNHRLRKLEIMARELDGQETAEDAGGGKADGADD